MTNTKENLSNKILENKSIDIDKVHPNPLNPRPDYHFSQNNSEIEDIALSLLEAGQHNAATVYELSPERPGEYMLLRGHRRRAGIICAGIETINCNVIERPETLLQEKELLGSEDANKVDWGDFAKLCYARDMAAEYGYPISHQQIVARTGITKTKLQIGEAVFALEDEIIEHVAEWEKWYYVNRNKNKKESAPKSELRIDVENFTPERAALIYRFFLGIRKNLPESRLTMNISDLELQTNIAYNTRTTTIRDMQAILSAIESISRTKNNNIDAATTNAITDLIKPGTSSGKAGGRLVSHAGNKYERVLNNASIRSKTSIKEFNQIIAHVDEVGSDLDVLQAALITFKDLEFKCNKINNLLQKQIDKERAK